MSNAAAAHNIVSLDDYRRARGLGPHQRTIETARPRAAPVAPVIGQAWVYWVPVWVW